MDSTTKYIMYGLGGVAVVGGVTYYMYINDPGIHKKADGTRDVSFTEYVLLKTTGKQPTGSAVMQKPVRSKSNASKGW